MRLGRSHRKDYVAEMNTDGTADLYVGGRPDLRGIDPLFLSVVMRRQYPRATSVEVREVDGRVYTHTLQGRRRSRRGT